MAVGVREMQLMTGLVVRWHCCMLSIKMCNTEYHLSAA